MEETSHTNIHRRHKADRLLTEVANQEKKSHTVLPNYTNFVDEKSNNISQNIVP